MKKASIVFITGSKSSLPFVNEAKGMGYQTIVIDNDPYCSCKSSADNFAVFSAADKELILGYLKSISDEYEIKGIMTYSSLSIALLTVSHISNELGLPHYDKKSIEITYDKGDLHRTMMKSGCKLPKTITNIFESDLDKLGKKLPLVLKLKTGIGSLGTKIIRSKAKLINELKMHDQKDFIVQEYIDGTLLHTDGFIRDNEVHFLTFFQKNIYNLNSVPLTKSFVPAPEKIRTNPKVEKLLSSIETFIQKTKMNNNFFGADFIFCHKEDDFFLLEIGYLLDVKVDRLLFQSGLNPYSLLLEITLGNEIPFKDLRINTNLALEFIYANKVGKLDKLHIDNALLEWEKDNLEISNLPKSVADVLGWGIYEIDQAKNFRNSLIKTGNLI